MEIVLTLAATYIHHNVDSAVRGKYALVTVRNFYLLLGGMGLLAFMIGFFDYCVKRLGTARVWRLLGVVAVVEAGVLVVREGHNEMRPHHPHVRPSTRIQFSCVSFRSSPSSYPARLQRRDEIRQLRTHHPLHPAPALHHNPSQAQPASRQARSTR